MYNTKCVNNNGMCTCNTLQIGLKTDVKEHGIQWDQMERCNQEVEYRAWIEIHICTIHVDTITVFCKKITKIIHS